MAKWLRTFTVLAEGLGLVPSTALWLTIILARITYTHTYIHAGKNKSKKPLMHIHTDLSLKKKHSSSGIKKK